MGQNHSPWAGGCRSYVTEPEASCRVHKRSPLAPVQGPYPIALSLIYWPVERQSSLKKEFAPRARKLPEFLFVIGMSDGNGWRGILQDHLLTVLPARRWVLLVSSYTTVATERAECCVRFGNEAFVKCHSYLCLFPSVCVAVTRTIKD
jgi:hypothetical protein